MTMQGRTLRSASAWILAALLGAGAVACGDAPGFAVWAEGNPDFPAILVLSEGSESPLGGSSVAYLVDDVELRQSAWVRFDGADTSSGDIAVYSSTCNFLGTVRVDAGENRVSIGADGTFAVSRFDASTGRGPADAPPLAPAPTDCSVLP